MLFLLCDIDLRCSYFVNGIKYWPEEIGVVVRGGVLKNRSQPLKTKPCVNMVPWQRHQGLICLPVRMK